MGMSRSGSSSDSTHVCVHYLAVRFVRHGHHLRIHVVNKFISSFMTKNVCESCV